MSSSPFPAKPLVAIVEDNHSLRRAMSKVLEMADFETKSFSSVLDFVNSGVLARLKCLVLDVGLPGIDGLRLQECIRSTNYELPIVFCSGANDDTVRTRAIAGGASCFLRKPVSPEKLVEAVRASCEQAKQVPAPTRQVSRSVR